MICHHNWEAETTITTMQIRKNAGVREATQNAVAMPPLVFRRSTTTPRPSVACVASVVGLLALSVGCSGDAGSPASGGPVAPGGSTAAPVGSGLPPGMGGPITVAPGTAGPATAGPVSTAPGVAGPDGTLTTPGEPAPVADPNALIPEPATAYLPTSRLARLSRKQWSNAVSDLLQLADIADIDSNISGDALVGFDTEADALYVTEQLRRQFEDAAEQLADRVTSDPAALARLVPADAPADAAGRASAFVTAFGLRAFRRPLTEDELNTHLDLFAQGPTLYPGVGEFEAGASLVIQAMLQSPHFLYRTELSTPAPGEDIVRLNGYEVASKLAFALTNTTPDDALLAAAAAGQLNDPAGIEAQVRQLLESPEGSEGMANFNFQVFRLGTYEGIERDSEVFPVFTTETPLAMRAEVQHFFDWIFTEGLGVTDIYTAPVGFINSDLAPIYGLDGSSFASDTFTRVDHDPTLRAGFLTQAGFLSSYASGNDPDIIHRGVFIATRLLCVTLPPPAPNATPLVDIQPDMTNRERVEATTGKGTCGEGCHSALLNPLGYAFENYDVIGQHRTMDRGLPVDAADTYTLDGEVQSFTNGVELSQLLAESKQTHSCYTKNMMSYLHGRLLETEDMAQVDYYARLSRAGMVSVRDLVLDVVTSDSFLTRLP